MMQVNRIYESCNNYPAALDEIARRDEIITRLKGRDEHCPLMTAQEWEEKEEK